MSNILMVPIHLDALYLEHEESVVEAMADFSRLPYFDGNRDVNSDIANLSEEIVSQPFQNQNLPLKAGIHLHWALPDALTKVIHSKEGTTFPVVPNRWLVTRSRSQDGKIEEKRWVVESDYLYPEGKGSQSGNVSIPFPVDKAKSKYQPFRYLGRKMPLEAWQVKDSNAEYLEHLTAVGYGEPTFAAFYPNCLSVFGFWDDDSSDKMDGLQYDLIGWYSNVEQDYLNIFIKNLINTYKKKSQNSLPTNEELLEAIKAEFKWIAALEKNQEVPEQMLCYARLKFDKVSGSIQKSDKNATDTTTTITVGNTGTEALSAYLATKIDNNNKSIIEDQLEALHLSSRLENRQLDIGAKFKEARHEKGFNAIPAGCLWTVRQETESTAPAKAEDAHAREQITLPEEMGHQLNRVNILQQAYDRAADEIESMQKQIFADWYKYMLCAYPPEGSRDDYPDIDEVRYYIETKGIAPLNRKVAATSSLTLEKDLSGKIMAVANCDANPTSIACQLAKAINRLTNQLDNFNKLLHLNLENISGGNKIRNAFINSPDSILHGKFTLVADTFLGNCLSFDGIDNYLQLPKINNIKAISIWVNIPSDQNGQHYLLDARPALSSGWVATQGIGENWAKIYVNGESAIFSWDRISKNQWTYIYLEAKIDFDSQINLMSDLTISHLLKGKLANICIYQRALSEEEIKHEYNNIPNKHTYTLRPAPAPRYWQPKEPVALMTGEAVQPTQRHGRDGRLREDGLLDCQILSNVSVQDFVSSKFSGIKNYIDKIQQDIKEESIGFSSWTQQPWHPFLLEWEVEVLPIKNQGNLNPESRNYNRDFITSSYKLTEKEPDLAINKGRITKADNFYSGRSILTPHARIQLKNQIEAYLKQELTEDYQDVKERALKLDNYKDYFAKFEKWYKQKFSDNPNDWMIENLSKDWYDNKPIYNQQNPNLVFSQLPEKEKNNDPIYTAIRAYQEFKSLNCLSQALSGFNQALLMHKQTLQLEIADPLGFDDYQKFTEKVRKAVQKSNRSAPTPLKDFNPIRSGVMKILQLRLVDTFGQIKELDVSHVNTTEVMRTPGSSDLVSLPPRLVQPARLNFRWLSASQGEEEMNEHPATTPICGWILPNNLDNSLMIYDSEGTALGSINEAKWESAPGSSKSISINGIKNYHLKRMVETICLKEKETDLEIIKQKQAFLKNFISTLNNTLESIEPENFAQHQGLALLMGRPLALVRASLNLELQGLSAINEDWNCFRQDLRRNSRDNDDFTGVKFPIRLGEYHQFNDGLVGYWKEKENGYEDNIFYAPQTDTIKDEHIKSHSDEPLSICQSVDAAPQVLTMLIDPRGKVHATSGILPTKGIDIPPEQYAEALQKIEITFLSTPILTDYKQMRLSLPVEPGYSWSWLEKENNKRTEIAIAPTIEQTIFKAELGKLIWNHLLETSIGWLVPIKNNDAWARVLDKGSRKSDKLRGKSEQLENTIEEILEQNKNHESGEIQKQIFLQKLDTAVTLPLWTHLLDKTVEWLQPLDGSTARVVAKDSRQLTTLKGNFAGLEEDIEVVFNLYQVKINPVSTRAEFSGQQVIREGWLKLSQINPLTTP